MDRRAFLRASGITAAVAAFGGVTSLLRPWDHRGGSPSNEAVGGLSGGTDDSHHHHASSAGGSAGSSPETPKAASVRGSSILRWSNPATWGGRVPGPKDTPHVRATVLLDRDASVAGLVIEPGAELIFDTRRSLTIRSSGNVVVLGTLTMRPASASHLHRLLFTGAVESRFVGGGMDPLATDVGLWVMDGGVLDLVGTAKRAWGKAAGSVPAGTKTIVLSTSPSGWKAGDEVAIVPTLPPGKGHHLAYDIATVRSVSGRTVRLDRATTHGHPSVEVAPGVVMTAEVLNLTRNVRIEGKPGARSHVFVHSMRKQAVRYTQIRYVGPRKSGKGVLGRYGLHFHHSQHGTHGSLIEGVVVRDAGNHAYVPHQSHGITFRNCISHDTYEEAYWWDKAPRGGSVEPTHYLLWDSCVASLVRAEGTTGVRLAGFMMGPGDGNAARNCVAVGVGGEKDATGFQWPNQVTRIQGIWGFTGCVAHNNISNGIWTYQTVSGVHELDRFTGYHNGRSGIFHGGYANRFHFSDGTLFRNGAAALTLLPSSKDGAGLRFTRMRFDAGGASDFAVTTNHHVLPAEQPTLFDSCSFLGYRKAAVGITFTGKTYPDDLLLKNCRFDRNELWLGDGIRPETRVQFSPPVRDASLARPMGQPGTSRPEWNASIS